MATNNIYGSELPFAKASKFVIDSVHMNGVVERKEYKTKASFLNRLKALGLASLDTVKLQKTSSYSSKGMHYTFIWE